MENYYTILYDIMNKKGQMKERSASKVVVG